MFMKFIIGKYVVYSGEQFYPIIKNLVQSWYSGDLTFLLDHQI